MKKTHVSIQNIQFQSAFVVDRLNIMENIKMNFRSNVGMYSEASVKFKRQNILSIISVHLSMTYYYHRRGEGLNYSAICFIKRFLYCYHSAIKWHNDVNDW